MKILDELFGPIKYLTTTIISHPSIQYSDRSNKYLTTPVATSMKHPTKRPVDGGFPEGSLLTFDRILKSQFNICFDHLCVHLVDPHQIAALPINALRDSSVVVEALNSARPDAVLTEVVCVQVILGCHLGKGDCCFHPKVGNGIIPSLRRCRPGPVRGRSSHRRSTR